MALGVGRGHGCPMSLVYAKVHGRSAGGTPAGSDPPLPEETKALQLPYGRYLIVSFRSCRKRRAVPSTVTDLFASPRVDLDEREDGCLILRSREPLGTHARSVATLLRDGADAHPERPLVGPADGSSEALTWRQARASVDALAQALLDLGLGPRSPLMILSGNSVEHLLLALAAHTVGVPVLPVSSAYSLLSSDHARVKAIAELCRPGLVFADDADAFGAALDAIRDQVSQQIICSGERRGAMRLDDLLSTRATRDVERAYESVGPESVAKMMFTSGSTGIPKAVITTHGMLCSNQQALGQVWPFLREEPPVLVDWLPWSHTFGGSHNLNQILAFGGTLYIDEGRPSPGLFERTLDALERTPPTAYYNVPAGYALLTPRLEADREFARRFFSRLRFMFYAAAALPEGLWERLQAVADEEADHPVPLTASWGCTETAPAATTAHFAGAVCGCIGVPLPGVTLKLIPNGGRLELRVRGANVTPGYYGDARATGAAFDEEGYYRTGDAVRLVDAEDPDRGLLFDGRLVENFKLTSGTWVTVGAVRTGLVSAAGGVLSDAVIAGHDREYVAALGWIDEHAAAGVCGIRDGVAFDDERLRGYLSAALARHNAGAGSAGRVARLLLLAEPPSLDAGEVTDKRYINQRVALERRAADVQRLFADPPGPDVILPRG